MARGENPPASAGHALASGLGRSCLQRAAQPKPRGCLSPGSPPRGVAARNSPLAAAGKQPAQPRRAGAEKSEENRFLRKERWIQRQTAVAAVFFSDDMYLNTGDSGSLLPTDKMFHLLGRSRNFKPTCLMKQPQDTKSNLGFTEN